MRKLCLTLAFNTIILVLAAQEIRNEVVGSAGSTDSIGDVTVSWTVGECLTNRYCNDICLVTQGFHQSFYNVLQIAERHHPLLNVKVYPNPTTCLLNIDLSSKSTDTTYRIILSDMDGKILLQKEILGDDIYQLHLFQFHDAIMILKVMDTSGSATSSFKIVKVGQ